MEQRPFSKDLQQWLSSPGDKTIGGLSKLSGEKAFAIIFLVLMALPALPIPTGGITHVTEAMTVIGCLQLIAGRRTIWLPRRWMEFDASKILRGKAAGKLIAFIAWFERYSDRRWSGALQQRAVLSAIGLVVLALTVAAFVAPPFSGLDTLPALGVVIISLALILEDSLLVAAGMAVGAAGIGLEIALGAALYQGVRHIF
jgi:hypothetical protein